MVGGQFGLQLRPAGFGQFRTVAQKRLHGGGQHRGHGGGVRRIQTGLERQRLSGGDLRQREPGQFRRVNGQLVRGNRSVFLFGAVENIEGARIERGDAAAAEIIVHFGLDGLNGGGGGGGVRSDGQNGARVLFRLLHPLIECGACREKVVRPFLGDAWLAGTVVNVSHAVGDFPDNRRDRRVLGALRHDNPVAVEQG